MLFSCQKSSRLAAFPPGWVQAYICPKFDIKRSAPVTVTEFYAVAADAQLEAVVVRFENLVELTGIEPVTPWLQTRCSPS